MPYIVYTHFETQCSDPTISAIIAGSLQLATTETEKEAQEQTAIYKQRADDFYAQYPILDKDNRRYGYYFWPHPL